MHSFQLFAPLLALSGLALGHPGHDITEEALERRAYLQNVERVDLSHCADKLAARGVTRRNIERRVATVNRAREKRSLKTRDIEDVLATNHNSTELGFTPQTDPSLLFSGNSSCILNPEVTQGPYYVGGEAIRYKISEDQAGVQTILDYQIIDVNTCDPVPNVYLEIWHCNSTGVYSGVVASSNGNSADASNINKTFHRGIQLTDEDGVAQFETTFPGHYTGRATHIHTMVHSGAQVYPNGTLGNYVNTTHVAQTYFDQSLIYEVEKLEPYISNTQVLRLNEEDTLMAQEAATGADPVFEYTYLGESVGDGLFGWIAFGYNATAAGRVVTPAAFLYENGGVANPAGVPTGGPPSSGSTPAATSSA